MTATTDVPGRNGAQRSTGLGRLPGFSGLLRKELTDWRRARRTWVVLIVSTLFMVLTALNVWLQANIPAEQEAPANLVTDPLTIVVGAVSGQIFVVAAVLAVMALIVSERDNGTLAWTASKPVSRSAIWLAKFGVATAILWVAAGLLPLAATVALVWALYGGVPALPIVVLAIGMGLAIALYVAVTLAASTIVPNQAAAAAIGLGAIFLPQLLGLVVPAQFLPTSILQWSILAGLGEPADVATVVSWGAAVIALVALSLWRMERLEL